MKETRSTCGTCLYRAGNAPGKCKKCAKRKEFVSYEPDISNRGNIYLDPGRGSTFGNSNNVCPFCGMQLNM